MRQHLVIAIVALLYPCSNVLGQIDNVDEQIYPDPITCFAMADHLYGENSAAPDHLIRMTLPGGDSNVDYPDGPTTLDGNRSTTDVEAIEFVTSRNKLYAANGDTLVYSEGPNWDEFSTCAALPYSDVDGLAYDGFDGTWYGTNHTGNNQADQIFSFTVSDDCVINLLSPAVPVESVQYGGRIHNTASDLAIHHATGELFVVTISDGGGNTAVSNINHLTGERSNTKFLTDKSDFHNEPIYGIEGFTSTPDNFFLVSTGINAKGYHREELFALVMETAETYEQQDLDDEQPVDISVYADTEAIACGQPATYQNMQLGNKLFLDDNADGIQNPGEGVFPGTKVAVWRDLEGDGSPDVFIKESLTDGQGEFLFGRLGEGDFIIQVPCSEFEPGANLEGLISSPIVTDPNTNINKDNNGVFDEFGLCAISLPVNLSFGQEPSNGGDANTTVDLGFVVGQIDLDRIYEETGGLLVMEAEEFETEFVPNNADVWTIGRSVPGANQGVYLTPLDNDDTKIENDYADIAPELRYHAYFNTAGTYYVWYRAYGTDASENSIHMGLNGHPLETLKDIGFSVYNEWTWVSTLNDGSRARVEIPHAGEYVLNMWEREDGTKVDRIVLSNDISFVPNGVGPAESVKNTDSISFSGEALLDGPWSGTEMETYLQSASLIPSLSPYVDAYSVQQLLNDTEVVDWVRIELRASPSASDIVGVRSAFVLSNGLIVDESGSLDVDFVGLVPGNYWVVVDHKSHLPIMSKDAVDFTSGSGNFDFTRTLIDLFGVDPGRVRNGVVLLWAGDVNGDNRISYSGANNDRVEVLNPLPSPSPFDSRIIYHPGDINMDGSVSYSAGNNDRVVILNTLDGNPTPFGSKSGTVPQ